MKDISLFIGDVLFNYRVGLLIECDDEILIEASPNELFTTIPGGRVKTNESSIDALIREINEEMHYNLNKKDIKFQGIIENFFKYHDKLIHELQFVYKIKISKNSPLYNDNMINYDSDNNYYKWIKKDEIKKWNIYPKKIEELIYSEKFEIKIEGKDNEK